MEGLLRGIISLKFFYTRVKCLHLHHCTWNCIDIPFHEYHMRPHIFLLDGGASSTYIRVYIHHINVHTQQYCWTFSVAFTFWYVFLLYFHSILYYLFQLGSSHIAQCQCTCYTIKSESGAAENHTKFKWQL